MIHCFRVSKIYITKYFLCLALVLWFLWLFFLAQQNSPKIHEGWWAYKEVVQGSFVPGKCNLKTLVFIEYFFTGIKTVGFGWEFFGFVFFFIHCKDLKYTSTHHHIIVKHRKVFVNTSFEDHGCFLGKESLWRHSGSLSETNMMLLCECVCAVYRKEKGRTEKQYYY